ncbi:hypothetical protein D3C72_2098220 [compost metagenome]
MHGVGADQDAAGAGGLKPERAVGQALFGEIPAAGLLVADDLGEVDRVHDDLGRGDAAEFGPDHLVDEAIIDRRALEAHAADQSDCLHGRVPLVVAGIMAKPSGKRFAFFAKIALADALELRISPP